MPEAISDSSILIHTARIERLDILKDFYKNILITPAVWIDDELYSRALQTAAEE